jgi:hypothetical protein
MLPTSLALGDKGKGCRLIGFKKSIKFKSPICFSGLSVDEAKDSLNMKLFG